MKKYPNITKYFNTTPRTLLLIAVVWFSMCVVLNLVTFVFILDTTNNIWTSIISFLYACAVCLFFVNMYRNQFTLVKTRIAKNFRKYYNLNDEQIEASLEQINRELENPIYMDATKKKKYCSFFITNNWIIGTDGLMLLRASAVKISNISKIEKNYAIRRRKGFTYYYYLLQVTDVKNHVYRFYLRSEENRDKAYDFLFNMFGFKQ